MENKPEQDGVWGGEGPQSSGASPTITCEFEHDPAQCSFPLCACSGGIPDFLRRNADGSVGTQGTKLRDGTLEGIRIMPDPKRKPKRDRAKYMRNYRAQKKAARTQ